MTVSEEALDAKVATQSRLSQLFLSPSQRIRTSKLLRIFDLDPARRL